MLKMPTEDSMEPKVGIIDELVSFTDLAPTLLSLAADAKDSKPSAFMEGRVFFGRHKAPEPDFLYCATDRLDGNTELKSRSIRTKEWRLIENIVPNKPYLSTVLFRNQAPGYKELLRLREDGDRSFLFLADTKPRYELYNIQEDPEEARNVASLPQFQETLRTLNMTLISKYPTDLGIQLSEAALVAQMYPNETQPFTEPVSISIDKEKGEPRMVLSCPTPSSSILYRFKRRGYAYFNHEVSHWFIYTEHHGRTNLYIDRLKAIVERFPNVYLEAKATRYGFKDSDSVTASLSA